MHVTLVVIRGKHFILPASTKLKGGILVTPCPFVRLWTASCPLCIFHNTCWIYFIFAHLIKQLKFWQIIQICNIDFVFFFALIQYESIVWVIIRRWGYPQNAGLTVVLVFVDFYSLVAYIWVKATHLKLGHTNTRTFHLRLPWTYLNYRDLRT